VERTKFWHSCIPSRDSLQLFVHVSLSIRPIFIQAHPTLAVSILFRNSIPLAQERAALSIALYHACTDFVSQAPAPIAGDSTRFFEAVSSLFVYCIRILTFGSRFGFSWPIFSLRLTSHPLKVPRRYQWLMASLSSAPSPEST
jgi:hypothetical protein